MQKLFYLAPLFVFFFLIPTRCLAAFPDVPATHENYDAIEYVQKEGIVNGYPDGTFKPDNLITRGELLKIVVNSKYSQSEIKGANCFTDVKENDLAKYICFAKEKKIISGYEDGSYKPENNVTFAEAAKIILNGLQYEVNDVEGYWSNKYLLFLSEKGAISTREVIIKRKDVAEIIWRLVKNITNKSSYYTYNTNNGLGTDNKLAISYYYFKDKNHVYYDRGYERKILEDVDILSFIVLADCYSKDKNNVYCNDLKIKEADVVSFINLSDGYAKDKNHVYYAGKIIEDVNSASFDVLKDMYTKDKKHIYYYGKILEGADVTSFIVLSNGYAKDKEHVFYSDISLDNADPESFNSFETKIIEDDDYVILGMDKNNIYFRNFALNCVDRDAFKVLSYQYLYSGEELYYKDQQKVYVFKTSDPKLIKVIDNADPMTFKYLGGGYSKDKNNIYLYSERIGYNSSTLRILEYGYAQDDHNIYYNGFAWNLRYGKHFVYNDIDIVSFSILDGDYAKNKDFVFYHGEKLPFAEPETFEIINGMLSKDKNHIYNNDKLIGSKINHGAIFQYKGDPDGKFYSINADPSSLQYIRKNNENYAIDKNNVYILCSFYGLCIPRIVEGALLENLEEIDYNIFKDQNHVFCTLYRGKDQIIQKADPKTFQKIEYKNTKTYYFRDKSYIYYGCEKLTDVDLESFVLLDIDYAKDKNRVYFQGEIVKGADPKTFTISK